MCAAPANPTLAEIVTEGLSKSGEGSPTQTLIAQATNKWMEEIKNDIWRRVKDLKFLQVTSYGIFPKGQQRYSNPTDFASDLVLTLLDGSVTGIAQGGSPGAIILAANEASTSDQLIGKLILVISGTGTASASQIITYDSTTKQANVIPNFTSSPAAGSGYQIIDNEIPLEEQHIARSEQQGMIGLSQPKYFYPMGDEDFGEFLLDCPPAKQYGARLRYYANIMKIDLSSTLMSTLYLNFRNLWLKGIEYRCWKFNNDDRVGQSFREYGEELNLLLYADAYGVDLHNIQQVVTDYA